MQKEMNYFNNLSFKELEYYASLYGVRFGENCKKSSVIELLCSGGVDV